MPTDTIDQPPTDEIAAEIDRLLSDLPVATPSLLCSTVDVDALAGLLREALPQQRSGSLRCDAVFHGDGDWDRDPYVPVYGHYVSTYRAEVMLQVAMTAVSCPGRGVREVWALGVGGNWLVHADGSDVLFDTKEAAMKAADRAMARVKLTLAIEV